MKDYDGNPIVEKLDCEYLKNNVKINDEIYIILTKNMENNLMNVKGETIYIDCTYKIVPRSLKNYKFLVIIGFNKSSDQLLNQKIENKYYYFKLLTKILNIII